MCGNYHSKSAPYFDKVIKTNEELQKLLQTSFDGEKQYQGGECSGKTYLSPFPRDGRYEFSQDYCHYDSATHTTDRDVVVCATLEDLNACPSEDGTQQALTSTEIKEINSATISRVEYDTKLCFSTISMAHSSHPADSLKPRESNWCQTIDFEHVTGTQHWTVSNTPVDHVGELKMTKLHPVKHTTMDNGDAAVQLEFDAEFHAPKHESGGSDLTLVEVTLENALLEQGGSLSYNPGCIASGGKCEIKFVSRKVPNNSNEPNVLQIAFGGTDSIDAKMAIKTNNGALDTTTVYSLSFALPVSLENVSVKKSSVSVETFHEINSGDEMDASALMAHKSDVIKTPTKQIGTGDEMVVRINIEDTSPLTSSYIYNAGLFLAKASHMLYSILISGDEARFKNEILDWTTNYKGANFWGHTEQQWELILTDYYDTNCKIAFDPTRCPCTTSTPSSVQGQTCRANFIKGVHWVDLIKEGVLLQHNEAKLKTQTTTAGCLEDIALNGCDAGKSGSYLNVKDTKTCQNGFTMETTTHQLATHNGDDMSSKDSALARACKSAKRERASSKSYFGASTKCDEIEQYNSAEFIIGSNALASYISGTNTDIRKFHVYVEVAHIQYYTAGCDTVLASSGRRLLAAAGVTEADVNKVITAGVVNDELIAVQDELKKLKQQIDVPKDSYNSASAKDAYDSASAQLHELTANYEALRGSASSYADQAIAWKESASATQDLLATEKQRTSGKTTHELEGGVIAAIATLATLVVILIIAVCYMMMRHSKESSSGESSSNDSSSQATVSGVEGAGEVKYRPLFRQAVDL
jgi:hypothetical protein